MTTTSPLQILVMINPEAAFGKRRRVGPEVVRLLTAAGHCVTSVMEPDFQRLAVVAREAIARVPDAVVVVGGDGMVHLGTNLVAGTKIPLGIVPSGSGNDMARGLGIPLDNAASAVETLLEALTRPARIIDSGRVCNAAVTTGNIATGNTVSASNAASPVWFACVLSAGFDAVVNERANRMRWPRGRSRYNIALLRELAVLTPISYRLELDGVSVVTDAMLVAVGNNTSFGGGMRITPDAELDDGLFDVLVVQPLSRLAFLRLFPRVFAGTHVSDPRVTVYRARRVRIEADAVVAYADGERLAPLPLDMEVVPEALRVLAPVYRSARVSRPDLSVSGTGGEARAQLVGEHGQG